MRSILLQQSTKRRYSPLPRVSKGLPRVSKGLPRVREISRLSKRTSSTKNPQVFVTWNEWCPQETRGKEKSEALVWAICCNNILQLKMSKNLVKIIHCLKMGSVGKSQCAAASPELSPARSQEWIYAGSLLKVLTLLLKFHWCSILALD